jgi:hypothetical protein
MADGFLNFHAEPRPAHERTIERLEFWVEKGFDDIPETMRGHLEPAVVTELCFRICGTQLTSREDAQNVFSAALRLLACVGTDESRDKLEGAVSWLRRTYL